MDLAVQGGRRVRNLEDEGEPLGRGVEINIYLKEEAQEYLEEDKLKELVEKYSEFINFPIYLWNSEEVEEEVPLSDEELAEQASKAEEEEEEDVEETDEDDESADDEDDEVEDEDEEELPTTKKVKKTVWDWKNVNDNKAIWLRSSTEVEDDEYSKFYKALSKDDKEPLSYTHFKAEGDVEFKSILFIPEKPPKTSSTTTTTRLRRSSSTSAACSSPTSSTSSCPSTSRSSRASSTPTPCP